MNYTCELISKVRTSDEGQKEWALYLKKRKTKLDLIMAKKIKKILIANRGEIAFRVIATAQEMGIKTVAIYTEDEKNALHVLKADESVSLGEGTIQETYLNKAKIISAIKETGADAVHPGYGFLSENADFCELVEKEEVTFIGPTPYHMNLMGDKMALKKSWRLELQQFPDITVRCKIFLILKKQDKLLEFLF